MSNLKLFEEVAVLGRVYASNTDIASEDKNNDILNTTLSISRVSLSNLHRHLKNPTKRKAY